MSPTAATAAAAESQSRVTKPVFVGTSSALFAICLVAITVRFYIRFAVQREIGWDDGWLMFGLCCLIAGMTVLYVMMDLMYEMESIAVNAGAVPDISSIPASALTPAILAQINDVIKKSVRYRKMSVATLVPLWGSICSVKFSFLALFKKLLRQMPIMTRYWWFVVAYNAVISIYGATVYIVACPYFSEKDIMKSLECTSGSGLALAMNHSIAQMVLDIVGDLFILVIPVVLVWQIRIRVSQKLALVFTLCLSMVMIMVTAARIGGLKHQGKLDYLWETYFIVVAAEIGLTLVAITAFRALYVAKVKTRSHDTITSFGWYDKGRSTFRKILNSITRKTASSNTKEHSEMEDMKRTAFIKGSIPHATMTGVRSYMEGKRNDEESVTDMAMYGRSSQEQIAWRESNTSSVRDASVDRMI